MGEAKKEETKPVEAKAEEKVEEKKEEKAGEEEKPKEEKKEEKAGEEEKPKEEKKEDKGEEEKPSPPQPPPPVVLSVDLHCVGCAKKIERCLLKCKGVEEVEANMVTNQVKIKGVVDPQALCSRIKKKTMRSAQVISPPPPPPPSDAAAADSAPPQVVASQVDGVRTVELHVNMHCEACAQQLRKRILKMRGVQEAETVLSSGTVKVTGTMTGDKIVDYIYRRTGKLAKVIPPPPPPPPPEEEKPPEGKPPAEEKKEEEKKAEEKKEGDSEGEKPAADTAAEAKKDEGGSGEEAKKEGETAVGPNMEHVGPDSDDMVKRMMYWNGGYNSYSNNFMWEDEMGKRRMMMGMPWTMPMPPVYVVGQPLMLPPPPPPQIFSDENPNACCIS